MYTVNWITKEIFIPVSDLQLITGTEYKLLMSSFHKEIRRLEWEFTEGLWADQILDHTNSKVLSGSNYAPFDEIINSYTITFDPTATKVFLEGSNNNIVDIFNYNGVSVIPSNSAGNTISIIDGVQAELLQAIKDLLEADEKKDKLNSKYYKLLKGTTNILLEKNYSDGVNEETLTNP